MTIAILGFTSKDIIQTKHDDRIVENIGGKAYYSGVALANLGEKTIIITPIDKNSRHLSEALDIKNIRLFELYTDQVPVYENIYLDENLNDRILKARFGRFKFDESQFTEEMRTQLRGCSYIHLGPANPEQMDHRFLEFLKKDIKTKLTADLDYFIKEVDENGDGKIQELDKLIKTMSYLDIVMISREDAPRIINRPDEETLKFLAEQGPEEAILTKGSDGALIYSKKQDMFHTIPAVTPKKVGGATGAGDTFIAAYLFRRPDHDVEEAGMFAAKITSRKIEMEGALYLHEHDLRLDESVQR